METQQPFDRGGLSRRAFIQSASVIAGTAAVAGMAGGPGAAKAAELAEPTAKGRMKVGCLSWCFHSFAGGVDPTEAIDTVGGLGFDGIELIVNAREDMKTVWAGESLDRIRSRLDRHKLQVSQFVLFQPVVPGLASPEKRVRDENVGAFEAGCRIAAKLNAPIIDIVSPWPTGYGAEHGYLPRFYEMSNPGRDDKFHIGIADDFEWSKVWSDFVETTRECVRLAGSLGLKMTIEHHTHCLIHDATSFMWLCEAVGDRNLGYNLDAGWTLSQREYPPLAIHKVGPRLMNLHMRDIDGQMRRFPPFGTGVMDHKAIVEACRKIHFNGFFSIEQDKGGFDMLETCKRYLRIMREDIG
ncbi:MAG: sugar phosphate isomerase/epimerase [Phycisphaerae bacterium]|nr:sugar phosphate isomerase/epimerase [Phycisphaerae bacterium]